MAQFWPGIEHRGLNLRIKLRVKHQVLGLPWPSIETKTFPCPEDPLRIILRTRYANFNLPLHGKVSSSSLTYALLIN